MQTNFEPAKDFAPSAVLCAQSVTFALEADKTRIEPESASKLTGESLVYAPHYLRDGAKHPGLIVKTSGLANVAPPPIIYRPHLPRELNDKKLISEFQFERVIYAGQVTRSFSRTKREPESASAESGQGRPRRSPASFWTTRFQNRAARFGFR